MFVYFDSQGVLKEIITERNFRVGDAQRDKIYLYWDGEHSPLSGWVQYRLPDGTSSEEQTFSLTKVGKELPKLPLRNLKYFSYEHTYLRGSTNYIGYEFYEITVPTSVLNCDEGDEPNENNMIVARIRFVIDEGEVNDESIDGDDALDVLGVIPFAVETNMGILTDNSIDVSQYNYLLGVIGEVKENYTKKEDVILAVDIDYALPSNYANGQLLFDKVSKIIYEKIPASFDIFYATYDREYINDHFAKLSSQNVFTYSPQTNEAITDASADTKLATKKYVRDLMDEHLGDYSILNGKVTAIESKIPSEASSSNKLADKDFVNSTVNSLAAFYITKNAQGDPFDTYAQLASATVFYSGGQVRVPTRNDYCMVNADETHQDAACRYIFQGVYGEGGQWEFQFVVNETAFTAEQIAAINSGITEGLVGQITTNANAIISINNKLPRIKDFVIAVNAWQLDNVSGRYYCEISAGNDFVIDDNAVKNYTGTSASDNDMIGTFGIIASSDATTQKFRFECYRMQQAPEEVINYTISMYGGN